MFLEERSHLTIRKLLLFLFIALPANKAIRALTVVTLTICFQFIDNYIRLKATNLCINDQIMLINQYS